MLLERRLREWLDIRGNPHAVKSGRLATGSKSGPAVGEQYSMRTYCAQCQDQDQGSDVHECVVGALFARATCGLCVGHIVALRKLSQEPVGRERRPGDVYAHKRSRSASTEHLGTSSRGPSQGRLVVKEERMEGRGASTRTGRELGQIIHPAVRTEAIGMLYRRLEARRPPWFPESEVK